MYTHTYTYRTRMKTGGRDCDWTAQGQGLAQGLAQVGRGASISIK